MRLLAKSLITSDDRNFANFATNVPWLKTRKILTLGGVTMQTEISANSGSQKFLNLQNFFKIFFEKVDFSRFRWSIFSRKGVRYDKFFFWSDRPFLGVKPHGRPKSRTGPPRGVTNFFCCVMILILVISMYLKNIKCKRFTEFPR